VTDHLEELTRLVDTAGAEVVGRISQQITAPNPATLIGEGKVEEVARAVAEMGASLVIFDEELSPVQGVNLERALEVRVMDRPEVILDIFSTRARSHEAKLQVELAQLEYLLPRLTRMWTHLSRIRGGIGLRGPGETQLETDRRIIRRRIQGLKAKLQGVERHRENLRAGRDPMLSVALVGYTNAGKSSILRALSGQHEIFVEDRLFATLDPLTRDVQLGENHQILLTDTVGFIRKLPHQLVDAFGATLEETKRADLLLHVVDASAPEEELVAMTRAVEDVLEEIGTGDQPRLLVLNKADALEDERRRELAFRHPDAVLVSALTGEGLGALGERIAAEFERTLRDVELLVPFSEGGTLSELHDYAGDLEREDTETGVRITARLPSVVAERYDRYAVNGNGRPAG
jgi:GTP-binding protein HflX